MMKNRKIALGPGAASLILIAVVLSLSMMGMLTLISARNDDNLSRRNAETIQENYSLFSAAEHSVAELDQVLTACRESCGSDEEYFERVAENLPMEMTMEDDTIYWEENSDARTLFCTVRILPMSDKTRYKWIAHNLSAEGNEDEEWN